MVKHALHQLQLNNPLYKTLGPRCVSELRIVEYKDITIHIQWGQGEEPRINTLKFPQRYVHSLTFTIINNMIHSLMLV